jgi:23S rRNA (cytidine1920-2'-O)/16S rRNA (cytidine1409-2'-O)-methyltransferase
LPGMDDRKQRLDLALVERGLVESRERARAQIMAGDVRVNDQVVRRPAIAIRQTDQISLAQPPPYVSRGGFKLAEALDSFRLDVRDLTAVDVGASTGGFTDVLLQRGCRRVYAVDVGHGQLAWRLRADPRVVVLDRTNVRFLAALPESVDAAVVDVSFISLSLVLPVVLRLLTDEGWIVALVKPQFEAGRGQVGKGGVVREPAIHREVLENVLGFATALGLTVGGCASSPILGPAGNREFLVWLRRTGDGIAVSAAIDTVLGNPAA